MDKEIILSLLKSNKGKVIGVSLGLIFGIIVLSIGFWRAVFLSLCIYLGYYIGDMVDTKEKFIVFLDRILPKGFK